MSDNLRYNEPTSGASVATDDVSGQHYQWFKLDVGPPNESIPITGSAYGVPVDVKRTESSQITLSGIPYEIKWVSINISGAGDSTVVPAVSGKRIRVISVVFTVEGGNLLLSVKSGPSTTVIPQMSFAARQLVDINRAPHGWFVETLTGQALVFNLSANRDVRGSLNYLEI